MHTPLLWCDIETTGLSPYSDFMLELALVLTDKRLNIVDHISLVLGWADIRRVEMDDYVRAMHERNGLFDAVERSDLCVREVERRCLRWVDKHKASGLYMGGSGPHFDRGWLNVQMPALAKVWSHRNVDLTTLRYFFGTSKTDPAHRALGDLQGNITDLHGWAARAAKAGLVALPAMAAAG